MSKSNRNPEARKFWLLVLVAVLCVVLMILASFAVVMEMNSLNQNTGTTGTSTTQPATTTTVPSTTTTVPPTTTTVPPVVKEASVTLAATGDMLMHMPVVNTCRQDSGYDFDSVFRYFADYVSSADIALANLETTLAGLDNGYGYSGYPNFNCPDDIARDMKEAGFDVILTANNHTYDTRSVGFHRTQEVLTQAGLSYIGTRTDAEAPDYLIVEQKGICLGLACYTYDTDGVAETKALNGIPMSAADAACISSFDYEHLDLFYREVEEAVEEMEAAGVDAVVVFLHWGNEYQVKQNSYQSAIAQKLCDLGVDVIIGGHPHVVQPVELLTSQEDESHKTVCLYSMGNAVSNQRRQHMNLNTGHTEDGVLFSVTFSRYSDGTVILESADLLPTWVDLRYNASTGRQEYNILPLDSEIEDWQGQMGLSDSTLASAKSSYDRTVAITGEGMAEVDAYLAQKVAQTEAELGVE